MNRDILRDSKDWLRQEVETEANEPFCVDIEAIPKDLNSPEPLGTNSEFWSHSRTTYFTACMTDELQFEM